MVTHHQLQIYEFVVSHYLTSIPLILVMNTGRIIVIGSIAKTGTTPTCGPYAATKAATEVLANTLAQELGGKGITVNTIHPGK
jgi:NAD(P)-dependent dehydrogenase (short-subunit alcohol dehydrogenase family)